MRKVEYYNPDNSDPDMGVVFAGKEQCKPRHQYGALRENYVFHYVENGKGQFELNGQKHHLSRGDLFVIFPGMRNHYQADGIDPWTYRYFMVSGFKSTDLVQRAGFSPKNPVIKISDTRKIRNWHNRLLSVLRKREIGFELKAQSLILELFSVCAKIRGIRPKQGRNRQEKYIQTVLQFIRLNYQQEISISQMAAVAGLHRTYLSALFRSKLHTTPKRILTEIRINKAKSFLKGGMQGGIAEVAAAVGYMDYPTFEKRFKAVTGQTPSEYRRKISVTAARRRGE
jgi:AraC-like DNA-binding protein